LKNAISTELFRSFIPEGAQINSERQSV